MPERRTGTLRDWHDRRGFGFIVPADGGRRVFAHVRDFPSGRRPQPGVEVSFVVGEDSRGRPHATHVRYTEVAPWGVDQVAGVVLAPLGAWLFSVLLGLLFLLGLIRPAVVGWYALACVVSFSAYGLDKLAAVRGRWRTAERTLHVLDVVGGWPGGLVARQVFRHKTIKQPFRRWFWVTAVVNVGLLLAATAFDPGGLVSP